MAAIKTLQLRIKDKHASVLRQMAREVNHVFNFANETSMRAIRERHQWLSGYDLQKLTAGYSKCDGVKIGSGTVQVVCAEYAARRKQFKKARLNWRVSNRKSSKYSLGWIPFKGGHAKYKAGQIEFGGIKFSLWDSYGLSKYELRAGSFSEDSRGRWYANICIEVKAPQSAGTASIGIDLGLKNFATMSDGSKIEAQRLYRGAEVKMATTQRANKKARVRAIHAQIVNRRKDFLHKLSTGLVSRHGAIFVGNVNASGLAKTNMAKSVLDAGWSSFRTMLKYKCDNAGALFEEVNEAYSTVTCSACGSRSGPNGLKELRIREWTCTECGEHHDRDTNAARNILARGHARLAVGIPAL